VIFLWDDFNREHATKHGVSKEDMEYIVKSAAAPFPKEIGGEKHVVMGPDRGGRIAEVIFAYKSSDQIAFNSVDPIDRGDLSDGHAVLAVYVIHAMPLTGRRLKQYRKIRR
jgi:uncharacterized DUF497 family protein